MPSILTRVREHLKGRRISEIIIDGRCPDATTGCCVHKVVFVFKGRKNGSESKYVEYLYGFQIFQDYFHYTTISQRQHFHDYWYSQKQQRHHDTNQSRAHARYISLFEDDQ